MKILCVLLLAGSTALAAPNDIDSNYETLNYATLVSRILQPRCLSCHCPDDSCDADDVVFTSYPELMATKLWLPPAATSRVLRAITRTDKHRMPPLKAGPALSADDVDYISRWIDAGNPP